MLDWMGSEADDIRIAFSKVFGTRYRAFGSQALQLGGLSDGNEGVQWNVAYDPRTLERWVGVNLEGMQYDDWPIARLIEKELREPLLPELVSEYPSLQPVIVLWQRDHWQATSRPDIQERDIPPTPIPLADLTGEQWQAALEEARGCLDRRRRFRGRATQPVTLPGGQRVEGEVSPHLMFRYMGNESHEWEELLREGKTCLEPVYEWAGGQSRQPVRF